jgi:hypothetical protein
MEPLTARSVADAAGRLAVPVDDSSFGARLRGDPHSTRVVEEDPLPLKAVADQQEEDANEEHREQHTVKRG